MTAAAAEIALMTIAIIASLFALGALLANRAATSACLTVAAASASAAAKARACVEIARLSLSPS